MTNNQINPVDLDALFAAESEASPTPSAEFLSRIIEDADRVQAEFKTVKSVTTTRTSLWHSLTTAIGGWPTIAGLATATIAGVWIGMSPPSGLDTLTETFLGANFGYSDYVPNLDSVLTEG